MSDNSQFLPNQHAVTSDCLFNLKPSSVNGRSYRCSIPPTNASSFNPSTMIVMYIPARRNCFLDPQQTYLRMTVKNNDISGIAMNLDGCGACFINRIDVFSGSNLLESTQSYNILYNGLIDLQMNSANRFAASGNLGTADLLTGTGDFRQGATVAGACKFTTCMPILSGVFGMLAEKCLPLSLNDDIRIEISLESNDAAVCYANAYSNGWTILNVELEAQIIELQNEGIEMINSVTPPDQPIYLHSSRYSHTTATIPKDSTGVNTFLVPARYASLKSLWCLPRRSTEIVSSLAYSLSSRINPNFQSWYWRVGSLLIPQKPVTISNASTTGSYAEGYTECIKAIHGLNNANYGSSIGITQYQIADAADTTVGDSTTTYAVLKAYTAANSYKNAFIIGQELEVFSGRNDTLLSGMNTLGSQIFFEATIGSTGPTAGFTLNFFAFADCIYVIQDGLISCRF